MEAQHPTAPKSPKPVANIHEAFLSLGCALICRRSLRKIWMTG
jgi:hypothetical protein